MHEKSDREIARILSREEGRKVSAYEVSVIAANALEKIRQYLVARPDLQEAFWSYLDDGEPVSKVRKPNFYECPAEEEILPYLEGL